VRLHFATISGVVMIKHEAKDGKMVYDARCPKCNATYETPAPR
jgi:cytochrome c5